MASREEIVSVLLNFTEDEFFDADEDVLESREDQLLEADFFGIAVNAPQEVATDLHDDVPLIMAICSSGERDWDVSLSDNCIMVGTNLIDGTVHFANAFVTEKELQSRGFIEKTPKGSRPPGLAMEAAQLTSLDTRERLDMEWNSGGWSLGIINYDWPSNTVEVELLGDEKIDFPPARSVFPEPAAPGVETTPYYQPVAQTPQLSELGAALTVEVFMKEGLQRLYVFGAFAVPVRPFHLPDQEIVNVMPDGREENVAAVVPVTFAVLGLDWDEPLQFDWQVPVYGAKLEPGMPALGNFAIDALDMGTVQFDPGEYLCYIVMDGRIFGPQSFQIRRQ